MRKNDMLWSTTLWRWLWFVKESGGMMVFEDAAGVRFVMSKEAAAQLTTTSWRD